MLSPFGSFRLACRLLRGLFLTGRRVRSTQVPRLAGARPHRRRAPLDPAVDRECTHLLIRRVTDRWRRS
jgi:hypothetical protein